jgi:hypothetical protein
MIEIIAIFLKVTSRKDQEQYWFDKRRPYRYVPVKKFAEEYENFPLGMQTKAELAVPFPKEKSHPAALATKRYSISNLELFKASFKRETILAKRNSIVYVIKVIQVGNHISSHLISAHPFSSCLLDLPLKLDSSALLPIPIPQRLLAEGKQTENHPLPGHIIAKLVTMIALVQRRTKHQTYL